MTRACEECQGTGGYIVCGSGEFHCARKAEYGTCKHARWARCVLCRGRGWHDYALQHSQLESNWVTWKWEPLMAAAP